MSHILIAIPLCRLKPSKANMRKTDRLAGIDDLAASIAANGLLENLVVHPRDAAVKTEETIYDVVAGGRRLEALKKLAKTKQIDRQEPIPCLVLDNAAHLTEISLAENFERVPPHPADQFEAFAKLVHDGRTALEVAGRFGTTETFVLQRLKLAQVSPRLIAQYRENAMTLDQLMAFTVSDDQTAQEQLWFDGPYADMPPQFIRRHLTSAQVDAQDRRALFIGAKVYQDAGGIIVRDLFDAEHEGYFQDSQLLDRLVTEKLATTSETLRAEGWAWVDTLAEENFAHLARYGRISPTPVALSSKDEKRLSKLCERYDALVSELEEDEAPEAQSKVDGIEQQINVLKERKEVWSEDDKARSGVCIALAYNGALSLTAGLLRNGSSEPGASLEEIPATEPKAKAGYPEAVLLDLSAHRTAALRAVLMDQPDNAITVLLYAFVRRLFCGTRVDWLEIGISETALDRASNTVGASNAARLLAERHAFWAERFGSEETLLALLGELDKTERHALLAYCVAVSVNTLRTPGAGTCIDTHDTALATLIGLNMKDWWKPTEQFLTRLPKAQLIEALRESGSPHPMRHFETLKRSELAHKAEALLAETAWIPAVWRQQELERATE